MKKCPYCAEEIQANAIKCKHCGEMLNENKQDEEESWDNSELILYDCKASDAEKNITKCQYFAQNLDELKNHLCEDRLVLIKEKIIEPYGKFSCPMCGGKYTQCERAMGCLVFIIIFISLGLGLIMIPFLPHHCDCEICDHKWKA